MTFTQAIASGFYRYLDFSTRSSRSEYWFWILFYFCVSIVARRLDLLLFDGTPICGIIIETALLIPFLALTVRRLHDVNRSGWWILILITGVGIIFPLLYWHIKPGSPGLNAYGANPLGVKASGGGSLSRSGTCVVCGSTLEPGADFCGICGSKNLGSKSTGKYCPQCGLGLGTETDTCFSCGISV